GGCAEDDGQVKIPVRPENVALIRPPAGQLGPLLQYQDFFLEDGDLAPLDPGKGGAEALELSPCSAFPAGLLARFEAALKAGGYRLKADDPRPPPAGFRVTRRRRPQLPTPLPPAPPPA